LKLILDLCGGTGSWSKPYKDAGYFVELVTIPFKNVLTYQPPSEEVYGILAAPPCTDFAVSGARWFKEKDQDGRTIGSMGIVIACLKIIALCQPTFWALENPVSRLSNWLGKPQLIFDPCDYGDNYTKRTCLWGKFNLPKTNPVEPVPQKENPIWRLPPSPERATIRSITPQGFANAFFEANR